MNLRKAATEKLTVTVLSEKGRESREDPVVREHALTVVLNNKKLVTILCSPRNLRALAIGYLFTQGFITGADDISSIEEDTVDGSIYIETGNSIESRTDTVLPPGGLHAVVKNRDGLPLKRVKSNITLSFHRISAVLERVNESCEIFIRTAGAHACALSDMNGIFIFYEDIGRHNAIDKVIGRCLLDSVPLHDKTLFTTGRISSAIATKVVKAGIPVLVSRSAPTFEAVGLAEKYGITLVGFAREGRMNVYTNVYRLVEE